MCPVDEIGVSSDSLIIFIYHMRLLFHSMNDRGGLIKYEIMRSICSFFQSCDLELSPVIQFTYAAQVLFCFWFLFLGWIHCPSFSQPFPTLDGCRVSMYLAAHGSDQAVGFFGVWRHVNSKVLRSIYYTIESMGFCGVNLL